MGERLKLRCMFPCNTPNAAEATISILGTGGIVLRLVFGSVIRVDDNDECFSNRLIIVMTKEPWKISNDGRPSAGPDARLLNQVDWGGQ